MLGTSTLINQHDIYVTHLFFGIEFDIRWREVGTMVLRLQSDSGMSL